jgi:ligand-binding sensor domain-containing protein
MHTATAQHFPWPVFTTYTQSLGLPSSTVHGLARDERGYLWAATPAGLSRFNGYRFETIRLTDKKGQPTEQDIRNIVIDYGQRIWVLLPNEIGWVDHQTLRYNRISQTTFRSMTLDEQQRLCAFTKDGMFVFSEKGKLASVKTGEAIDGMKQLNNTQRICWMGNKLMLTDNKWKRLQVAWIPQADQPEPVTIRDVWVYAPDKIFIASYGRGVMCYNPITEKLETLPGFTGRSTCKSLTVWKANNGKKWLLAAADRQWWMVDPETMAYKILRHHPGDVNGFPFENQSLVVYTDSQGIVWTGNEDGIAAIEPFRQELHRVQFNSEIRWNDQPLFDGVGLSFYQTEAGYFIGAWYSKGWHWFDTSWQPQKSILQVHGKNELLWKSAYGQYYVSPNNWWLSTDSGLVHWTPEKSTVHFPAGASKTEDYILRKIVAVNDSVLMIQGRKGIFFFSTRRRNYLEEYWAKANSKCGLPDADVHDSWLSKQGNLYASTSNGWYVKPKGKQQFELLANQSFHAATNGFLGMAESSDGSMYTGSYNGLYSVKDGSKQVKAELDAPATKIFHIQFDKQHRIWATSTSGLLCRFSKGNWWQLNHDNSALPVNYLDGYFEKDDKGRMYVGANKWHIDFDPAVLIAARPLPKIEIDAALVDDKMFFPKNHEIQLPVGTKTFSLLVNNLNFDGAPGNGLLYRLSNASDTIWQKVEAGRILFANLDAGTYTIEVRGQSFANAPLFYTSVQIAAYWYQQKWFYFLCIVVAVGLVVWAVQRRMTLQRAKSLHDKQLKEAQMQALRTQMNPHFVFNSLNSINSFILDQKTDEASEYLTTFSKLLRTTLELTRTNSVKLERELAALQLYIDLEKTRVPHFNYSIDVHPDVQTDMIEVPPLVLQPFVENAIWHGLGNKSGPGHLHISITQPSAHVIAVSIQDDGIGREASKASPKSHVSLGVEITEHRLKILHPDNSVEYEDLYHHGIAAGTKVRLFFHTA